MDRKDSIKCLLTALNILADGESSSNQNTIPEASVEKSVDVPGGILPVDADTTEKQRVHSLVLKPDGTGCLRAPNGKERPLTSSDLQLFKQYFVSLGKLIQTIKPATGM